ncbi:unnamed protein product [Rotaria magnacalcarata]|uniref:Globin-sensor domain-containing protein n=4 Tax=Rotaria magnacalcarata TaxID=392030 RepID=A0A8S2L0F4_9BILA|nr:unnamed protein product [Rotaria magnacalcarata]CAF3885217.1 unnamed protein product [Rotaria magnacalcarata]
MAEHIDRARLNLDLSYRFKYVSKFIDFKQEDIKILNTLEPIINPILPTLVETVYKKLYSFDITKQYFLMRNDGFEVFTPNKESGLTLDCVQIDYRKDMLSVFLRRILTQTEWNDSFLQYLSRVGEIHTNKGGSSSINVDYIHVNALICTLENTFIDTIWAIESIDWGKKREILHALIDDLPKIRGQPKLHKIDTPMRIVTCSRDTITSPICQFIFRIIKELSATLSGVVCNTSNFIKIITDVKLNQDEHSANLDIQDLYTNIPVSKVINITLKRFDESKKLDNSPFTKTDIKELLILALKNSYFQFNGKFYKQKTGLPMCNTLSPTLPDIYMNEYKKNIYMKFDVIGISKVRWAGKGEAPSRDFIWLGEDTAHTRAVGMLLSAKAKKKLIGYNSISSRVITARFNATPFKLTVIHVYAPTSASSDDEIEIFYDSIEHALLGETADF